MLDLPDSPPSLWLAEYGEYQPEPALAGDLRVDAAVRRRSHVKLG
jgi:hypothetical protein